MTDETKKLLDAPWAVDEKQSETFGEVFDVMNEDLYLHYARCYDEETANRIARLPELYDALVETVYLKCFECMGGLRHNIDLTQKDLIENGCPKQNKSNVCIYAKHIELLRKVRDGK